MCGSVISNNIDAHSHVNRLIELIEQKFTRLETVASSLQLDGVDVCAGTNRVDVVASTKGVGNIASLDALDLSEFEIDVIATGNELVLDRSSIKLVLKVPSDDTPSNASSYADWAGDHASDGSHSSDYVADSIDDFPDVDTTKGFAKKAEGFACHQFDFILAQLDRDGKSGGKSDRDDNESFGDMDHCECEELSI
jgi:hypothetical protein